MSVGIILLIILIILAIFAWNIGLFRFLDRNSQFGIRLHIGASLTNS